MLVVAMLLLAPLVVWLVMIYNANVRAFQAAHADTRPVPRRDISILTQRQIRARGRYTGARSAFIHIVK